jgi:Fungalysin metallopeptidase (M36)
MAKRMMHADVIEEHSAATSELVAAQTQAAQLLRDAAAQMTIGLQTLQQTLDRMASNRGAGAIAPVAQGQINAWEDDPFSEALATEDPKDATPIQVAIPANNNRLLQTQIDGPSPVPRIYAPHTPEFRYWTTTAALARGVNFWAQFLPVGTRWTTFQDPMRVTLVAGEDLNANYTRQFGLRFFQATVKGRDFFSSESPDVACHELGHAILDAIRPELFDAASTETAAFHESFGDMSAILSALQIDSLCEEALRETGGRLNVNSRLSRLAEQLGWAIRQLSPTAVDPDCLRNAANRFFYRNPDDIPPSTPASQLSSEAHSFSRVFTGAFLDILARMVNVVGPPTVDNLRTASGQLAQLLIDGIRLANIVPTYYSQVAASMIQADRERFDGKFQVALMSSFAERGILEPASVVGLAQAEMPRSVRQPVPLGVAAPPMVPTLLTLGGESDGYLRTAHDAPELPIVPLRMGYFTLEVCPANEHPRFDVAPASLGVAPASTRTAEDDARAFVEDLIQLGRIDFEPARGVVAPELMAPPASRPSKKTHTLVVAEGNKMRLKRLHFDCCGTCCAPRGRKNEGI